MLKFKWHVLAALAAAVLTVAAGSARADYISSACTVIASPTELGGTLDCPQFTGSGSLVSVDLTIDGGIAGSITLVNGAQTEQTVSATTTSQFFQDPALTGVWTPAIGSPLFTAYYTTGSVTLDPGQTLTIPGLLGTGSWTGVYTGDFTAYIGSGTFGIPIYTATGFSLVGGGGQVGSQQTTNGTVTATVGYTFRSGDEVPEPQTWGMMAGGLALLGLARIRRRC